MSQHDGIIADASGAAFLADLNLFLPAILSCSSGLTQPSVMYAYQWWADTTTGILKQRNGANTAWVSILTMSTGALVGQGLGTPASGVLTNCTGTAAGLNIGGNAATVSVSAAVTGAVSSSSPTAGIGYATGAGGSVTQLTSISTGVTLNKISGKIICQSANLAQGQTVSFPVSNTSYSLGDCIIATTRNATYVAASAEGNANGEFYINLTWLQAAVANTIVDFVIIKGVSA